MTEGHDAVVVLAGRDGRDESVGHAGEPRVVVMRRGILQPVELVVQDAVPHVDGMVHAPELVDVAHEVDVGTDGLAHDAHALDRRGQRRLAPALHLHLPEAHAHQPRARLGEIVHGVLAHEGATRIGRHAVTQVSQERAHRFARRLALEIPARDVHRGEGKGEDAAGTGAARGAPDLGPHCFGLGWIVAHDEIGEGVDSCLEGRGECAPEEGEAKAHQTLIRAELEGDELARVGGLGQPDHEGVVGGRA